MMFQSLTGLFEPSAIAQLPDGRFLVVEDEQEHPFSLVTLNPDGSVSSQTLGPGWFDFWDDFWKLDDLEALAHDSSGNVYALTSHSRDGDGDEKKARDKLVRFKIKGDRVVGQKVVTGLKRALAARHPVLAAAADVAGVKTDGGLNIEAMEISPDQQHLLIGFRSPLKDKRAIIARVESPAAMFDADAPPQVSADLTTLDLDGHGIRGMCHVRSLGGYLIISGPVSREAVQFELWFWSGQPEAAARRVSVPGLHGFERAEGISPALVNGQPRIIIVSDDGSRKERRNAHFLLLEPKQLHIAP